MTPGARIANLRETMELNQTELAKKIEINRSVLNRIEQGTRPIRDDELKKIADFFHVSTDYLLGTEHIDMVAEEREQYIVSKDEHDFVQACRKLSPDKRQAVLTLMKSMAEK